jgi:DNA-directed RNA polymerase subunit M/transcription elongation factor TFIIS
MKGDKFMSKNDFIDTYYCYECGTTMEKADEDVLVCPNCGHSVDIEDYATEEEDYEDFYNHISKYDDPLYWHDNEEFPGEPLEDEDDEE